MPAMVSLKRRPRRTWGLIILLKESEAGSGLRRHVGGCRPCRFRILVRSLFPGLVLVLAPGLHFSLQHKHAQQIGSTNPPLSDSDRGGLSFRLVRCCFPWPTCGTCCSCQARLLHVLLVGASLRFGCFLKGTQNSTCCGLFHADAARRLASREPPMLPCNACYGFAESEAVRRLRGG